MTGSIAKAFGIDWRLKTEREWERERELMLIITIMMTCVVMPRTKWKSNLVTASKVEVFTRLIRELSSHGTVTSGDVSFVALLDPHYQLADDSRLVHI